MLYTEILPDDTDQPGITKQQFETAISVWTWMQPGDEAPNVAATAASFNTTPEIVRDCVRVANSASKYVWKDELRCGVASTALRWQCQGNGIDRLDRLVLVQGFDQ